MPGAVGADRIVRSAENFMNDDPGHRGQTCIIMAGTFQVFLSEPPRELRVDVDQKFSIPFVFHVFEIRLLSPTHENWFLRPVLRAGDFQSSSSPGHRCFLTEFVLGDECDCYGLIAPAAFLPERGERERDE